MWQCECTVHCIITCSTCDTCVTDKTVVTVGSILSLPFVVVVSPFVPFDCNVWYAKYFMNVDSNEKNHGNSGYKRVVLR